MTSQSSTPVASTSVVTDNASDKGESTDKDAKKKGIGIVTGWLRMVEPRKVPYFPQIKDKIVYLRQAHESYLKEVTERKIYKVTESDKLWVPMAINDFVYLIIIGITFEKFPMRVACLEVKRLNEKDEAIGPSFKLKYHDMGDVVDFLVLKTIFDEGLKKIWNVGDRFRCLIGNRWFFGEIKSKEPYEKEHPNSPFKTFRIKWDDERDLDQLSPWEFQDLNKKRLPKNHGENVEVLNIEIVKMRYKPCPGDWPNWEDWKATIKNIIPEFDLLMSLPISKCFVEIQKDPVYDAVVLYPIDLSTIKERLVKYFYRRIDSLLMDISYIEENAEKHKSEKFIKEAKLITRFCNDLLTNSKAAQGSISNLKDYLGNFNSSESEDDDNEYRPCNKRARQSNSKNNWQKECKHMLNILWNSEDMFPFRKPVCRKDYPDYYKVISSPICLEEIKTKFDSKEYNNPKDLFDDIKLIITNSRKYNQDKEKAIYHVTTRISNLFDELKKHINYKKETPRKNLKKNNTVKIVKKVLTNKDNTINNRQSKLDKGIHQNDVINQSNTVHDETIGSNNNNYKKDLKEKLLDKTNETNLAIETSKSTVVIQNNGKEEKSTKKTKTQDNLDNSSVNIYSTNLPQETRSTEDERMEDQMSQSQRRDSTDLIVIIDSDSEDEEKHQEVSTSAENLDNVNQAQVSSTESSNKNVINTSQEKSKSVKSHSSVKAKKKNQFRRLNRIFQWGSRKSCVTCRNIRQLFKDHIKSHHA